VRVRALFACRFLESEVDLDVAIKELHVLATAPGLYGDFVKLNAVRTLGKSLPPTLFFLILSLVSCLRARQSLQARVLTACLLPIASVTLLQHENNDIMVDTINLLHELTQSNEGAADEAEDEESDAFILHETFIVRTPFHLQLESSLYAVLSNPFVAFTQQQEGGLDILLSNLERLDEKIDEEKQGIYNMMGILENVSEVMPEIGVMAMKNDVWRKWVLRRYAPPSLTRWSCVRSCLQDPARSHVLTFVFCFLALG
jgi:beta-catenin-like protein 1